ncbi:SPOR domain-containing protein [Halothiobacillus sp. DCM-1]|uniref:SPOR domain-containing protein n=1 Tax=Halothiobacillus sp. DCM-1 TaxID=3112558 RepID=UPI0032534E0B
MIPLINQQTSSGNEPKTGARLRQRLIGGMVIVAIGALVLPLWLDNGGLKSPTVQPVPPPPAVSQPEQINIPAPSPSQMQTLQNPPAPSLANNEPPPSSPAPATTVPPTVSSGTARSFDAPAPKPATPPPAGDRTKAVDNLKPAPIEPVHPTPEIQPPTSQVSRRPSEPAKPEAPRGMEKPAEPAPSQLAISKPTSNGDWVVQLGSFSDELNARALAKSVEEAGFHAALSPLFAKKGTVWRVRVGPYATRDQAIQTTVLLREKLGRDGLVMPNK